MATETYALAATASGTANAARLESEVIADAAITKQCSGVDVGADVKVHFLAALDAGEKTALDAVVAAHQGQPLAEDVPQKVQPTEADYGGSSRWHGDCFAAAAGTPGDPEVTDHDVQVATAMRLIEGTFRCDGTVDGADRIDFQIVDVDNLLGYGAGFVVAHYVQGFCPVDGERRTLRSGQAADVPAGFYLRTKYTSKGGSPTVRIDWLGVE